MIDKITVDVFITIMTITMIVFTISSIGIAFWYKRQIKRDREQVTRIVSKLKDEVESD